MRPMVRDLLAQRKPILYDGATTTVLRSMGLAPNSAAESWVMENGAQIFAVAQSYVNAGAQIIMTCTTGGTEFALRASGISTSVYDLNQRAAEIARQAAGDSALVAGALGSLGNLALQMQTLTYAEAVRQYGDQASALVEGGADLLHIETMSDMQETRAAIEGVRRVTDLPIFVTLSFDTQGRTALGLPPDIGAQFLVELGVDAIGANCGRGPEALAAILREMRRADAKIPLIAKPNTGEPDTQSGKPPIAMPPLQFANWAREWIRASAKIIGGCCGTTPQHIAALKQIIAGN
ncbi:MAG: homocysteine S-methyltransferase family protein [Chloroflexi bacterium]|nr:homocysteine S-methyltransferase family protein [Chloroflexota bacterium]